MSKEKLAELEKQYEVLIGEMVKLANECQGSFSIRHNTYNAEGYQEECEECDAGQVEEYDLEYPPYPTWRNTPDYREAKKLHDTAVLDYYKNRKVINTVPCEDCDGTGFKDTDSGWQSSYC